MAVTVPEGSLQDSPDIFLPDDLWWSWLIVKDDWGGGYMPSHDTQTVRSGLMPIADGDRVWRVIPSECY